MRPTPTGWKRLLVASMAAGVACSSPTPAPEGVTALAIADPRDYWAKNGFVQLVPPVHLPSSSPDIDQVEIWVRLPDAGEISGPGEPTVGKTPPAWVFPAGSVLDRVEFANINNKRYVVDVRGTRVENDGAQSFHVYRRGAAGLFGFEWKRSDEAAHTRATAALVARLAKEAPAKNMDEAQRVRFLGSVEAKNACAKCHAFSRPSNERQKEHGIVNRGTDASGFVTPWTLLASEIPLEWYGAHDASQSDPFTTIRCPEGVEQIVAEGRSRCASSEVPVAQYDLDKALVAEDSRALRICAGRRFLLAHMTPALRGAYAAAASDCQDKR